MATSRRTTSRYAPLENAWRGFAPPRDGHAAVDVVELARAFLHVSTEFRPPVLAVLGAFLLQSALNKVKALERGHVSPPPAIVSNCGERANFFCPGTKAREVTLSKCHVCERSVSFRADVRVDTSSKWRRGATGRVYLATRADDYYPRTTRARTPAGRRAAKNAENAR